MCIENKKFAPVGIHAMTRDQFAAEKRTAYPHGFDPVICEERCLLELQSWRCAMVYHHFASDGSHRGLTEKMQNRKHLESAYDALKMAYQAAIEVVIPCAA